MDAAKGVVKQQGIRGLYSGLSVTLVEIVPYAALQFGLYDLFTAAADRAHFRKHPNSSSADVRPLYQYLLPRQMAVPLQPLPIVLHVRAVKSLV